MSTLTSFLQLIYCPADDKKRYFVHTIIIFLRERILRIQNPLFENPRNETGGVDEAATSISGGKKIYIISVLDKRSPKAEAAAKEHIHFARDVLDKRSPEAEAAAKE